VKSILLDWNETELRPRLTTAFRLFRIDSHKGRVMATKKTAKSEAKPAAHRAAKTAVSRSKLAAVSRTKALPRKAASAKASLTTLTKVHKQAARKGQSPSAANRRVTTAQPAARVSAQRLRLPSARLSPVKLPRLDNAIKVLEKMVSSATTLTGGTGRAKILIDGNALLAIKQVISALSSTPDNILIEDQPDIELTSQEVADMLNVSRPYVVKQAREGQLPYKMVGNRHRFLLSAVQEYEGRRRVGRDEALTAIVPEAGYTAEDF
jgi:excisionase family DNA binding protein